MEALEYLLGLTPVAGDAEIRCIGFTFGQEVKELFYLLQFFKNQFQTKENFDFFQAYLHLTLKVHEVTIAEHEELFIIVEDIQHIVNENWTHLESLFQSNLCLTDFFLSLN